jgi:hypothetical protein
VRVCCRVNVEKRVHLAIGSVSRVVAICGLVASLESTSVRVELRGRSVVLGVGRFGLLSGGLRVLFHIFLVGEPAVIGSVRGVLVVGPMDAWVVALPPVLRVFVVVWQGTALAVADELFMLNCQMSAASHVLQIPGRFTLLLGRRLLQARDVVGISAVVPQQILLVRLLPAVLSSLDVGEVVLLAPCSLGAEDLTPNCLLQRR